MANKTKNMLQIRRILQLLEQHKTPGQISNKSSVSDSNTIFRFVFNALNTFINVSIRESTNPFSSLLICDFFTPTFSPNCDCVRCRFFRSSFIF